MWFQSSHLKLKWDTKIILPWTKKQSQLIASPLNNIISIQDMSSGSKKWHEDTSISSSQQHLCHYKFLLKLYTQESKEKVKYFNTTIFTIHNTTINPATSTAIPLKRSFRSHHDRGENTRINILRAINEYETDFNLVHILFWPRLITTYLESRNLLSENQ